MRTTPNEAMDKTPEKKDSWSAPVLTIYGSVEELTRQTKNFGSHDGYTFMGTPIGSAS